MLAWIGENSPAVGGRLGKAFLGCFGLEIALHACLPSSGVDSASCGRAFHLFAWERKLLKASQCNKLL